MIQRDGYWWPDDDDWCWRVIHDEIGDIEVSAGLCKRRDTVVQAGGNVGVWASVLARTFGQVITAEPVAANFECLQRNVPDNVIAYPAAFGAEAGLSGLELVEGNSGAHWIAGDGDVPVITIDSLDLASCDLIILDVEGAELAAFRGAERTLRKFRPVVHFEEKRLGQKYYGLPPKAAQTWLERMGYRVANRARKDIIMVAE